MGTFDCGNQCDDFCKVSSGAEFLFQLSDLYPGLTKSERALAAQEPVKTLRAYFLSWKAEGLCLKLYTSSGHNDESDACRHFVWAVVLNDDLGKDFARKVLTAHEDEPEQLEAEMKMDLANNERGLAAADRIKRNNSLRDDKILNAFREELDSGKLTVLKKTPQGGQTK
jgi:hypothetical protein